MEEIDLSMGEVSLDGAIVVIPGRLRDSTIIIHKTEVFTLIDIEVCTTTAANPRDQWKGRGVVIWVLRGPIRTR